ncbi:cytidine deaminase [Methylocapsa sp. D3K7]|uniref:cytidine deaminase n=1 Tax=Methylocapsa sp. D3K7 TaxID=3041435 RepID=UPI00244E9D99|nr:cytidine deaminase [Methylocapsa sp. D3K7]WGJ16477.1 cytidine deaminase [Methylocapsa sp. D3K7]
MIVPLGVPSRESVYFDTVPIGELFSAAVKARSRAYAPYSGFAVGAAVRTQSGVIFSGANVENSAFPVGTCAEAAAIAAMIVAGERRIAEVLIVAEGNALVTPCGACRQRIYEFAEADAKIYVAGIVGIRAAYTMGALLPVAFGHSIKKASQT